jgi:hypothetical protein
VDEDITSASNDGDWLLVELVEELEKIDADTKLAKLNEISMIGKDGLRIFF